MKKVLLFLSIVSVALMSFTTAPKPTTYNLDASKSTFKWIGKKVTGQHYGNVNFTTGQVISDGNNIVGGTFTVDMGSISVKDLEPAKGGDKLLGHLKSDDFFGVANNPTATLAIKKELKSAKVISYDYIFTIGSYPEGDAIMDVFIHPLDLVCHLFGECTIVSFQKASNLQSKGCDTYCQSLLKTSYGEPEIVFYKKIRAS